MSDTTNAIDERLANALEASNYRITLHIQKQNSKLKLKNDLIYSYNGGIFTADKDLISFVYTLIECGKNSTILLDTNDNPIEILDLRSFFDELIGLYHEAMNEHLRDFNRIKMSRNTSKVVEW